MFKSMMLATVVAAGVMCGTSGTAEAGRRHHHGHHHHSAPFGYGAGWGGYPGYYGGGVVVAPRPYVYPSYPAYGYGAGCGAYPYGYGYGGYGPAFGLRSGNFSLYLGR